MKRRVGEEIRYRESRQVGRDMEGFFEHGLGAAHRPCAKAQIGCDRCTCYSAGLSVLPVVDEVSAVRQGRIKVVTRDFIPPLKKFKGGFLRESAYSRSPERLKSEKQICRHHASTSGQKGFCSRYEQ